MAMHSFSILSAKVYVVPLTPDLEGNGLWSSFDFQTINPEEEFEHITCAGRESL